MGVVASWRCGRHALRTVSRSGPVGGWRGRKPRMGRCMAALLRGAGMGAAGRHGLRGGGPARGRGAPGRTMQQRNVGHEGGQQRRLRHDLPRDYDHEGAVAVAGDIGGRRPARAQSRGGSARGARVRHAAADRVRGTALSGRRRGAATGRGPLGGLYLRLYARARGSPTRLKKWTYFPWSDLARAPGAAPLPLLEAVAPPSRWAAGAPPTSHAPTRETLVTLPSLLAGWPPPCPLLVSGGTARSGGARGAPRHPARHGLQPAAESARP